MYRAGRAVARAKESGIPLPDIPGLEELYNGYFKFRPRGGQVTLIAGQPGSQKSGLALWWAARMNVPTLYFSADLAIHTATTRLVGAITGETVDSVGQGIADGNGEYYEQALANSLVRLVFNPNPTTETFKGELDAWVEAYDDYPRLVVIDNLLDVVPDSGDNEFSGYKAVLLETKTLARVTGAAVFVLHHMSESGTAKEADPTVPSPRRALQGKVSQSPENVISVAFDEPTCKFNLSVVKHRSGPSSPTGKKFISLRCIPEQNRFVPWTGIPVASQPIPTAEQMAGWTHYERKDTD